MLALLGHLLQGKLAVTAKKQRQKHKQHLREIAAGTLQAAASGAIPSQVAIIAAHAVDSFTAQVRSDSFALFARSMLQFGCKQLSCVYDLAIVRLTHERLHPVGIWTIPSVSGRDPCCNLELHVSASIIACIYFTFSAAKPVWFTRCCHIGDCEGFFSDALYHLLHGLPPKYPKVRFVLHRRRAYMLW